MPGNPVIKIGVWDKATNSVVVEITSVRATQIEVMHPTRGIVPRFSAPTWKHTFYYDEPHSNATYTVRVKNASGYNPGSFQLVLDILDEDAPVITEMIIEPGNDVWAASKTMTIRAYDQTRADFYVLNENYGHAFFTKNGTHIGGDIYEVSFTVTDHAPDSKMFRVYAVDWWGLLSGSILTIAKIDSINPTKPTMTVDGYGEWHNKDATVTISGGSAASGIDHYIYRIDSGEWQIGNRVTVTSEGVHDVEAKSVSGSGLESDIESITVRIDKTKPTASYTLTPDDWTAEDVIISLYPADAGGSGLAGVTLPNGETVYDFTNIKYPARHNGDYGFIITDNAENSTVVVVPVGNIAMLDVTVTLSAPFVISPDNDMLYAGDISFQNYSNVPVSLTLERMTAYDSAPQLVGRDDKAWKSLSVSDTKKYIALGLTGNGVYLWLDAQNKDQPHLLGTIAKGGAASYYLQGKFGYAWEKSEQFTYGMTVKVSLAA